MQIRPYRDADRSQVIALWHNCGLTRPWNDPDRDIDRKLTLEDGLFLVGVEINGPGGPRGPHGPHGSDDESTEPPAAHADAVIATAMVGYDGHRGWVNYLAVAPGLQGQGHGRRLMREAEQLLEARGCPKLNLQVRSGNTAVLAFYAALGYAVDDAVSLGKRLIKDD